MKKRAVAVLCILSFLLDFYVLADDTIQSQTYTDVVSNAYSASYELSEGLTYTRNIDYHPSYGLQREYIFEYTPNQVTRMSFVNSGYLYKTDNIRNMASVNFPDENYVAGMNADFFNMSTGVPESAFISGYELYTTDRDSFCLAERTDGTFFIDKPSIVLTITDEYGVKHTVLHFNKEFSEYGLYLYSDKYSPKTNIKSSNTSLVLYPYSDRMTFSEMAESLKNKSGIFDVSDADAQELDSLFEALGESSEPLLDKAGETEKAEITDYKALLAEKVREITGYHYYGDAFYKIENSYPRMGKSEELVVTKVIPDAVSTDIPKGAYVLSADNSSYGYVLRDQRFSVGSTLKLDISGNEAFYDVKMAIGTGTVIVKDGVTVDDRTFSHYLSAQPRTAVGIKEDGSIVLYAADGRQKNFSTGLKLIELAEKMKSLGCVYAANLDGGGSTAVNASLPGFDIASTVNSPSEKTERRVSNAIIFTNSYKKDGKAESAYVYGDHYITLSGKGIEIGDAVAADKYGFSAQYNSEDLSLYSKDGGYVSDGKYYPDGTVGTVRIYASLDGKKTENAALNIVSVSEPDSISLTADKTVVAPFDSVNLKAVSNYRGFILESDTGDYTFSVSPSNKGDKSEEAPEAYYGYFDNGAFYPRTEGQELIIKAGIGNTFGSVAVKVDAYPFADIKNHWAVREIYELNKKGIVIGELSEDGTAYYFPERQYSRYEFCIMLQRITGIGAALSVPDRNTSVAVSAGSNVDKSWRLDFADADSVPEWAYDALYRIYMSGLLDDVMHYDADGNMIFDGSSYITREEVMKVLGKICGEAPEDYDISAYFDLPLDDANNQFVKNVINASIFSGYEDGSLRPYNLLTRAEAAAVFIRLSNYLSK